MRTFVFPEQATVQLMQVSGNGQRIPLPLAGVALGVRVFARAKNDYHLGPFFSDAAGRIMIDRRALEASAAAELDSGLMDYARITDAHPVVELRIWTGDDIRGALKARETWGLLPAERALWPSLDDLRRALNAAPNGRLRTATTAGSAYIRGLWDGSELSPAYELLVQDTAAG